MKQDPSLRYKIDGLYKVKGTISGCFEMYMGAYIETEEEELRNSTLRELEGDLRDPQNNSLRTEDVMILNSSLKMFNKMKHLFKRASSLSKG